VDQEEMPAYSELTRRLGFEFNGMVLHEYYFDNLKRGGGTGDPDRTARFAKAAESSFGSYEIWKQTLSASGRCVASAGDLLSESGERTTIKPLDHAS